MAIGGVPGDEFGSAADGCGDVVAIAAPGGGSGAVFVLTLPAETNELP